MTRDVQSVKEGGHEIRSDSFEELQAKVRHRMGRGVFLMPTRVMVGNTLPRDISDEAEEGDHVLKFENARLLETELEWDKEAQQFVIELPSRDDLAELSSEADYE